MNVNSHVSSGGAMLTSPPNHEHNGAGNGQPSLISQPLLDELVEALRLMADKTRLQILCLLTRESELHVGAFCRLLVHSQPSVSHHLALLREGGLIDVRREGKHNFYRLVPQRIQELFQTILAEVPLTSLPGNFKAASSAALSRGDGNAP